MVLLLAIARQEPPLTARVLEQALLERFPERHLLDILAGAVHCTNCVRHFGPPSGTEPRGQDSRTDYIHLLFSYGTNLGPVQAARHFRGAVSAHTLSYLNRRHVSSAKLNAAQVDLINAYHPLTLPRLWGTGTRAAAGGTALELVENNPLAEYHFRYRMRGGIAYRHVADNYIAIFTHCIPCGVWEAVYIIEGLLQNRSEIQPRTVHADTQGNPRRSLRWLIC